MGPIVGGTRLDTLFTEDNYYQTFNAKSGVEERKLTSLWFVGKNWTFLGNVEKFKDKF